jgi:hypothetical protein
MLRKGVRGENRAEEGNMGEAKSWGKKSME